MASYVRAVSSVKGLRWGAVLLAGLVGCEPTTTKEPATNHQEVGSLEEQARLLTAPPGCEEITLGEMANGIELTPVMYTNQPTLRGDFSSFGDPAARDRAFIRLDVDTTPGLYNLATAGGNTFACDQCVFGTKDSGAATQKDLVAESGTLLLALKVSPDQTIGALANVVLREAVDAPPLNAPFWGSALVPGGECKWIRFATWNTVRQGGCDPRQGSLTANLPDTTCVPTNYVASDGTLERSLGTKTQGEACTTTPAASEYELASTDCEQGYTCTDLLSENAQCTQTCDFLAADPGCPQGMMCGVYGLCTTQAVLQSFGFRFDTAPVGSTCTPGVTFAEFCGSEGARGTCLDLGRTGTATCLRYERARTNCGPGEELGYFSYSRPPGGFDRTMGFCYHDGL
ncbi:hypothetical protein K8640_39380 [Myxococcus sp. XM-1-1-1]|nr:MULTISPECIES: hypothetical protein [unclassified Myxococcus]MBZ4402175.1 hypothetical protein [Myxococcus sp. AS-1-15]MBZ4414299.1 hypothetical protein [Myxococcus sp. XM-1-1-1]